MTNLTGLNCNSCQTPKSNAGTTVLSATACLWVRAARLYKVLHIYFIASYIATEGKNSWDTPQEDSTSCLGGPTQGPGGAQPQPKGSWTHGPSAGGPAGQPEAHTGPQPENKGTDLHVYGIHCTFMRLSLHVYGLMYVFRSQACLWWP